MIKKYFSDLKREFSGYNLNSLSKDLMAGVTVAAVALPLALAFGVACGADAASGMIAAIVAGIVISLLSGASFQISGPTGAMSAVLVTIVSRYSLDGMFVTCLIAGIIMLVLGIFKLGKLVNYIPAPVITGFTSGIAVVIALGQVDNLFGTVSHGETAVEKLLSYFQTGFNVNISTLLIGLLVIAIMIIWPKKWNAKVPSSLVAIIIAGIVSYVLKLDIPRVGDIPKTLILDSRLHLGSLKAINFMELLSPAITIAALGMIESLLCGSSASRMKSEPFDADRELVAQGIGNIVIPFFGGVPCTAAIARTSVAIKSGCQTRLTGIFHSLFLIACMFLLAPVMAALPLSALAGVLMMTAWRMNEWESITYIFKNKFKGPIFKFLVTMIATVVFDLTIAIVLGIVFSIIVFVFNISKLNIDVSKVENDKINSDVDVENLHKDTVVVYLTGPLFFTNCDKLIAFFKELAPCKKIILSMRGVPYIDITATSALLDCYLEKTSQGTEFVFSGLQERVMENFSRGEFMEKVGQDKFYWSVDKVLLETVTK